MGSMFRDGKGNLSSQRLMVLMLVIVASAFAFCHPGNYAGYLAVLAIALGSKEIQKVIEKQNTSEIKIPNGFFQDDQGNISIMRICCFILIIVASIFMFVHPDKTAGYTGMMSLSMGGKLLQKTTEKKES